MIDKACLFCKIIGKKLHTNFIYENDLVVAFNDISPQAPIHILIIPKKPIQKLSEATKNDEALLGHLMIVVKKVAEQFNVEDAFNVVINNGEKAGQTVFHLHIHLLAGKNFADLFPG